MVLGNEFGFKNQDFDILDSIQSLSNASCFLHTVYGKILTHTVYGEILTHTVYGEILTHTVHGEILTHPVYGEITAGGPRFSNQNSVFQTKC